MIWKVIGQSVIGTSHIQSGKGCEDALHYECISLGTNQETLIGFVSDGAGSAIYAELASKLAVQKAGAFAKDVLGSDHTINKNHLFELAESIYDTLEELAQNKEVALNEFSCTLLGFIILPERACFLQIGDGAIVRNDGSGHYTHLWWPHNGEYQNTTTFLIDDPNFRNLKTKIIEESIQEVAIFTDGLQMLTLNNESESVHQPFFKDLFKWLRMVNSEEHLSVLNGKLSAYLSGNVINSRTDDDKTLLLATRLNHDGAYL
jgi:hypothetical protein